MSSNDEKIDFGKRFVRNPDGIKLGYEPIETISSSLTLNKSDFIINENESAVDKAHDDAESVKRSIAVSMIDEILKYIVFETYGDPTNENRVNVSACLHVWKPDLNDKIVGDLALAQDFLMLYEISQHKVQSKTEEE